MSNKQLTKKINNDILNKRVSHGCLAQLGEHRLYTAGVGGSIPSTSTIRVNVNMEE